MDGLQNLSLPMTLAMLAPFVSLLLAIAILPLVPGAFHWWEKSSNKLMVSFFAALIGGCLYFAEVPDVLRILHTYLEYAAFISMLTALFVVSGGIHISGTFAGFPRTNTFFLLVGAVLANLLGTTGASMVLIRPLLSANRLRKHKTHIVLFFIFVVSNCGGLLTPLGDPPLYLGFLNGVPFTWTFKLLPIWGTVLFLLLAIFYGLDKWFFRRENPAARTSPGGTGPAHGQKIKLEGRLNIRLLLLIVVVILLSGNMLMPYFTPALGQGGGRVLSEIFQTALFSMIAWLSFHHTDEKIHKKNEFQWGPMREVGILFFGIFGAMIPALAILEARGSVLNILEPWQYFWVTGFLSAFLDNAPSYLALATLATGQEGIASGHLGLLAAKGPSILAAISCGSVLMGALTYIGNGPNFMVKAIAEHSGVKMPSFVGYMVWSFGILIPIFALIALFFF